MKPITIEHFQLSSKPNTKEISVYYYNAIKKITLQYSNFSDSCIVSNTLIGKWRVKNKLK